MCLHERVETYQERLDNSLAVKANAGYGTRVDGIRRAVSDVSGLVDSSAQA